MKKSLFLILGLMLVFSMFVVSATSINIISPTIGQSLSGDISVKWQQIPGVVGYDVLYSTDGGASWILSKFYSVSSEFIWDSYSHVPYSNNVKIKVADWSNYNTFGVSGVFTVDNRGTSKAYYRLTNNQCSQTQLFSSEVTPKDFTTLSECNQFIVTEPQMPKPLLFSSWISSLFNWFKGLFGIK